MESEAGDLRTPNLSQHSNLFSVSSPYRDQANSAIALMRTTLLIRIFILQVVHSALKNMATVSKKIVIKNGKIFEVQSAPREDWGGRSKLLSTSAKEEGANLLNNIGVVDCRIGLFASRVYFPG